MQTTASHSLRRRLLVSAMAAILLAAVFQAVSAYRGALRQADEMFDYHLQQMAFILRGGPPLAVPLLDGDAHSGVDTMIQIWGADGTPLFQSRRIALPARAVLGFSDLTHDGVRYRVYSMQTDLQTIQIAQDMDERESRARALAARAMAPMAAIAPLLMLVLWWVIRRSLDPLERTRQQIARRAVDDLSPLSDAGLPDEVRPLVQEINLLFGRLHLAFDAQKSFVANAAHELRSPLTALKLQAQALERTRDDAPRKLAGERLQQGIDRAIRLMNQLLLLARQEALVSHGRTTRPLDLQQLVQHVVEELLPQAAERAIDLGSQGSGPLWLDGEPDALRILLRNLLENAIKYSPHGGRVDVALAAPHGRPCLTVEDSGPGIPEEERAQVFERFFRGSQTRGSGSGLGLAIVQAIARRHHATVNLGQSAALGGLQVRVAFGDASGSTGNATPNPPGDLP